MIPLILITGFLGSGKTTLLRRIADRTKDLKVVYLVNEFSFQDIDGELLSEEGVDAVVIPGGSIFCHCLVTDFIQHLSALPERFGGAGAPINAVVVEASGIANPRVVQQMLVETRLNETYELARVITVVDPKSFLKLIQTLPNIRSQVEAADWVILNKLDLGTPQEIAATESEIEQIRPGAKVIRTRFCDADLDLFGGVAERDLSGEYAERADPNYARLILAYGGDADLDALEAALREAGDAVFRMKGFAPVEDGTVYVDYSAGGFRAEPCQAAPGELQCIVHGPRVDEVRAVLSRLPGVQCFG
jgi:G3E family GTPase